MRQTNIEPGSWQFAGGAAAGARGARVIRPWMLAGMFAFVPHLVAVLAASAQRPGFSHRMQYLSELGERGSATAGLVNFAGILPTGLLLAWFGLGLLLLYRGQRAMAVCGSLIVLHGVCRVIVAFFPCDAGCRPLLPSHSQSIHNLAASIGFVALTAAVFTAAAWLRARRRGIGIVAASYALGATAVAAQVLLVVAPGTSTGLYQRVALGALQLWVVLFAIHSGRSS